MKTDNNNRKKSLRSLVFLTAGIGLSFWIIETFVELYVFRLHPGLVESFLHPHPHELWMRVLVTSLVVSIVVLLATLRDRRKAEAALMRSMEDSQENYLMQRTISALLEHTLEPLPFRQNMERVLDIVLAFPLFGSSGKGCFYSFNEKTNHLVLEAEKGMPESIRKHCAQIDLGRCLCGKAAHDRKIIFSRSADFQHEIQYEGIAPHCQYCIPILSGDRLIGVLTLYLNADFQPGEKDEFFLRNISHVLAGVLRRHQVEASLRNSEMKFHSLFDQATDSIFLLRLEGNDLIIEDINEAGCAMHEYEREELIGRSITMLDDPEAARLLPERVEHLLSGRPLSAETIHVRKDGSRFPVEISARSIEIEGDTFVIAFDRDITQRKIAEEALLFSRKALMSVLDGIEAIIYAADLTTYELLYMNKFAKKQFGGKEGQLCWQALQSGQSGPCNFCTNDKLLTHDGQPAGTYHWQFQNTLNGRWYDIQDRAIQWVDGRMVRLEIATDVTDLKLVEQELNERMQLAELTASIGTALTEGKTLHEMLDGCTAALVNYLDALFARIWIFNEQDNILELKASSGLYTHLDGFHSRKQLGKYKIGTIAQKRMPIVTNNVIGDPQISDQDWAKQEKVVSFAGHPLIVEDRLIGVMALFSRNPLPELTLKALKSTAGIIAVGIDQKMAEDKITIAKEEWERTFDIIPDIITVIDTDYRIARANRALANKLDMDRADIIGRKCYHLIHGTEAPPDYCPHVKCIATAAECVGEIYEEKLKGHYIMSANPLHDKSGRIIGSVHVARDITARKMLEKKLEEAAITDELTGLFNRRGFFTLAEQQCRLAERSGETIALLYVDLDGFKNINDELGHDAGDQALKDMAAILRKTFRASDIVSRIGGDEFAVLLTEPTEPGIEKVVTGHLQKNLNEHNQQAGRPFELLVSMGMVHNIHERRCSIHDLMREADKRMYQDKKYHRLTRQVTPILEEGFLPRRIYTRFSAGEDCWAELDISGKARIKNISLGGACLKTARPLAEGSTCSIRISPSELEDITITGTVIWTSQPAAEVAEKDLACEAGLKFTELSGSIKNSLEKLIEHIGS